MIFDLYFTSMILKDESLNLLWKVYAQTIQLRRVSLYIISKNCFFSMMHYKTIKTIGQGSFGCVFLIKDNKQRSFALKRIHVHPFDGDQAQKEIEVMKKFVHPNLIKIYDSHFDQEAQNLQIIMEYCEQGDLLNYYRQKNKQLSVSEILRIFKQIVEAFIVMSVKGVFHRDLKPENLLIGKGMIIKVADFGCARSVSCTQISKIDNFSTDKGTQIYASPQQLKNESYSSKCDVWSAGCLLYFIYKGKHPFVDTFSNSRAHNTLQKIKELTMDKEIQIDESFDATIGKIISLTLIYEDRQRATWRELWLSRFFSEKIADVESFIDYLKKVTIIANWMAKEFWKSRKEFTITQMKDEIFVYFIIKFQYTNLKMALHIINRDKNYRYLFDPVAYDKYEPTQDQFNQIRKAYIEHEKYFTSIKKSLQTKEAFKQIKERQPTRFSAFSDLDNSIRAGYKILLELREMIDKETLKTGEKKDFKIWTSLARWINFEKWFSYEKQPRVQKLISQAVGDVKGRINEEINRYQMGIVE